jgi:hypothetical protein
LCEAFLGQAREDYVFANLESLIGSANTAGARPNQRCRTKGGNFRQIDIVTNNSLIAVGDPGKLVNVLRDFQNQVSGYLDVARTNGFANVYFAFDTSGGASVAVGDTLLVARDFPISTFASCRKQNKHPETTLETSTDPSTAQSEHPLTYEGTANVQ